MKLLFFTFLVTLSNKDTIVRKLREKKINIHIFEERVKIHKNRKVLLSNIISKIKLYIEIRRDLKEMKNVDNIFFPFPDSTIVFLFIYYSLPKQPLINYIDDGFATSVTEFVRPFFEAINNTRIAKLLYGWRKVKTSKDIYVFSPEMILYEKCYNNIIKVEMQRDISMLFIESGIPKEYSQYRFIYFDQNFDVSWMVKERESRNILIKDIRGNNKVLTKAHPANLVGIVDGDINSIIDKNMWECECGELDLEGKSLISFWSTAIFTPALLYNKEYEIVLLHRIGVNPSLRIYSEIDAYICRFKKFHENINVIVPNTWDELSQLLCE